MYASNILLKYPPESGKKLIVGVSYSPNTTADLDIFTNKLRAIIDQINMEHKPWVIMGHMNVDFLKYSTHVATDTYVDGIFSSGFIPRILKPTIITHTSPTLLDHIITNDIKRS